MQLNNKNLSENLERKNDDLDDEDQRTLFCGNLHDRVTEETLYELFIQSGPVQSVRIPKDKNGRQRAFGFITYVHACSVTYTLDLFDGIKLFNRRLTLQCRNGSKANQTAPIQQRSIEHSRLRTPSPPPIDHRYDGWKNDKSGLYFVSDAIADNREVMGTRPKGLYSKSIKNNRYDSFDIDVLSRLRLNFLHSSLSLANREDEKQNRNRNRNSRNQSPFYRKSESKSRNDGGHDHRKYRDGDRRTSSRR